VSTSSLPTPVDQPVRAPEGAAPEPSTGGAERRAPVRGGGVGARIHGALTGVPTVVLWLLVALWSLPSVGLLISSFRPAQSVRTTGWWTVFTNPELTLDNYRAVFSASGADAPDLFQHFLNSLAITIPATVIPIAIAAFAAYAFAWMDFKGKSWLFVGVVALLVVPLQMSLIPLLQLYTGGAHLTVLGQTLTLFPDLDLAGTPAAVWLTHIGFGLPLAIFLLHNYIASLPKDMFEAARIDGADHPTIFWRLVVPLSVPALAAFGIFQFLWVWNDYLVALTFVGTNPEASPLTIRLATLSGSRGQDWHLLTAAAFVSTALPLVVFFSLQRYFVRGLLAGSVKG
jgi:alpha-glucoside transport system permease protein